MGWQVIYVPFLFAGDTIINQNGIFIYHGTPTLGNLKISIAPFAGTDNFGNVYTDNVAAYNIVVPGGGYAQIAANPTTGLPYLVLNPPDWSTLAAFPTIVSQTVNAGLVNEYLQMYLESGWESAPGSAGNAVIKAQSRSNDATVPSLISLAADTSNAVKQDGNTYTLGSSLLVSTSNTTINSTTPIAVNNLSWNVIAKTYKVRGRLACQAAASGTVQPMTMRVNGTATATSLNIEVNTHIEAQGGSVNYGTINTLNADPSVIIGTLANSVVFDVDFEGIINFSAAGTFLIYARCTTSSSDESFTVGVNSWAELEAQF